MVHLGHKDCTLWVYRSFKYQKVKKLNVMNIFIHINYQQITTKEKIKIITIIYNIDKKSL